jgi:hypothetical protein
MRRSIIIVLGVAVLFTAGLLWLKHSHPAAAKQSVISSSVKIQNVPFLATERTVSATPPKITPTPPRLRVVFGLGNELLPNRCRAIDAVTSPLTPEETAAIYEYLHGGGERGDVNPVWEHVIKNNLMGLLMRQAAAPTNLLQEMCGLYQDRSQDSVTRDYAVQFVIQTCLRDSNRLAAGQPAARETLWAATSETNSSIAGTALLGLNRLAAVDPAIDPKRLDQTALNLAMDPKIGNLTRITALQVCAQRHLVAALPTVVKFARRGDSIAVKAAAIAALGDLGSESEHKLLQTLHEENDPALSAAVSSALHRLEKKLASGQPQASANQQTHLIERSL